MFVKVSVVEIGPDFFIRAPLTTRCCCCAQMITESEEHLFGVTGGGGTVAYNMEKKVCIYKLAH